MVTKSKFKDKSKCIYFQYIWPLNRTLLCDGMLLTFKYLNELLVDPVCKSDLLPLFDHVGCPCRRTLRRPPSVLHLRCLGDMLLEHQPHVYLLLFLSVQLKQKQYTIISQGVSILHQRNTDTTRKEGRKCFI